MRISKTLTFHLLLGAALLTPLTVSQVTQAELTQDEQQSNDQQIVLELGDRQVIIEAADGAGQADIQRVADTLQEMVNGSPEGTQGVALSSSDSAETLINDATANTTGSLRIKVFRGTGRTPLASALKKQDAKDEGIIEVDLADVDKVIEVLDQRLETRTQVGGTPSPADPAVVDLVKRLFLLETLAHEIGHAGTNLVRSVAADGTVTLTNKPGTTPSGNNFPDPPVSRVPQSSPLADNFEDVNQDGIDDDKGHAVTVSNTVIAENLSGTDFEYERRQYFYIQAGSSLRIPIVFDLNITAPKGDGTITQVVTAVFAGDVEALNSSQGISGNNNTGNNNNTGENRPPPQTFDAQRNRRKDRACAASTASLVDVLLEVPEFESEGPLTSVPGFEDSTGGDVEPDTDTDGTDTDDADTDVDTNEDTDDSDSESEGDTDALDTDDDNAVTCSPDNAAFAGDVVPQAGVDIDLGSEDCETVSGLPPQDQLVIDDFGDGNFGGSGSALAVVSIDGGTFSNDNGFFILEDLETDTPITITLEDRAGTTFSVELTIDTTAADARLTNVRVVFNP